MQRSFFNDSNSSSFYCFSGKVMAIGFCPFERKKEVAPLGCRQIVCDTGDLCSGGQCSCSVGNEFDESFHSSFLWHGCCTSSITNGGCNMKKNKKKEKRITVERVVPFGSGAFEVAEDGLFDDCPLCQELRKSMKAGTVTRMKMADDLGAAYRPKESRN